MPGLALLVLEGNQPCLLGRDWLSKIKLKWESNFSVTSRSVGTLQKEYQDLFEENQNPIRNLKAHIRIKEQCKPIFCKARPVPYALKERVEEELKKLENRGVIYPVKSSEWAAPIVVVPKPDKSVRLCGDYKVSQSSHQ
jgi:hypothetical protein